MNPAEAAVADAYDDVARQYDKSYGRAVDLAEDAVSVRVLKRVLRKQPRVLDVGCGTGWFLDQFGGWPPARYRGLDLSMAMVERAKTKWPKHSFWRMNAERMPQFRHELGPVDAALCLYGVLNHTPRPELMIKAIYEMLSTDGIAVFSTFTERHDMNGLTVTERNGHSLLTHTFSKQSLTDLLERQPWSRVRVFGMNATGWPMSNLLGTIPLTGWLRAESATFGRLWPDACHYLFAVAEV